MARQSAASKPDEGATEQTALGVILAAHFAWDIDALIETLVAGLREANAGDEADCVLLLLSNSEGDSLPDRYAPQPKRNESEALDAVQDICCRDGICSIGKVQAISDVVRAIRPVAFAELNRKVDKS